jgi:hypothetical protein
MDIVQAHRTSSAKPEDSDEITTVRHEETSAALQAEDVTVIRSQLEQEAETTQIEAAEVDDVTVATSSQPTAPTPHDVDPSQSDDVTVIAAPPRNRDSQSEEKSAASSDEETQVDPVERLT